MTKKINAAGIMLFDPNDGKILMGLRSPKSPEPNTWAFFGGKQEQGESLEDCARREVFEETGIKYTNKLYPIKMSKSEKVNFAYYLGVISSDTPVKLKSNENPKYEWKYITDIIKIPNLHPEVKKDIKYIYKKILKLKPELSK